MFYEQRMSVPDTPADLRAEYDDQLASIADRHGLETALDRTGVDREELEALLEGESPDLSLEEAAEIQALESDEPDAETIETMACEHLLLGMTTAVLDVDAVESHLEIDLDAKEVQQKIERRAPMSFAEYVHLQHVIVGRSQ
ncbi:hypothetical protein C491_03870 [Natronococcus amylolyticus DSM 10524]|uniref:Uncharacterized protein n=1 Tax=Natronococcus amylolyticus DSM 10524 TaxID=1227497 RepID=L9XFK4_9EURY|nr:DUF5791 family protein [Natronococcus amylolyticus]ELY60402.1 hypothetical protein C491_03870 [Natronococcus amylolyticus DSM 10524]